MNFDAIMYILLITSLAAVCIGIGVFFIIQTGTSKNPLLIEVENDKKNHHENESSTSKQGFESTLEKQNQMISSWNKTEKMQSELKLMQVSSEKNVS